MSSCRPARRPCARGQGCTRRPAAPGCDLRAATWASADPQGSLSSLVSGPSHVPASSEMGRGGEAGRELGSPQGPGPGTGARARGGGLGVPSRQRGFHRVPVLACVAWAGRGDPHGTAFQEWARSSPRDRGLQRGRGGQGRPTRGTRGAHCLRPCSSGGRSQPVYTPFATLYSSSAPKQGSWQTRGPQSRPEPPPSARPPQRPGPAGRGVRGAAHSDKNVRVPQHNQQSFGSGDGNIESF